MYQNVFIYTYLHLSKFIIKLCKNLLWFLMLIDDGGHFVNLNRTVKYIRNYDVFCGVIK